MKRGITLSLSLCLLLSGITAFYDPAFAADNAPPNAPSGLLMDLSSVPLGIESAAPEFSWVVNDSDKDEFQTAYQILIATDPQKLTEETADIWNSGKILSNQSTHVVYGGDPIPADGIYWWTVRTWDKKGAASAFAVPQFFSTAVKDNWQAEAIWSEATKTTIKPATLFEDAGLTDYIFETDFVITSNALGFCFRKTANNGTAQDMYMWQIRAETGSSGAQLRPHIAKGTSITTQGSSVDLRTFGISIKTGETHNLKISCIGSDIKTYIDGILVATHTRTEYGYGTVGFRNGVSECGSVDNMKISKPDGTVLYSWNFDDGVNPMSGGSIQNGSLVVDYGAKFFYVVPSTMTALVDYALECDFNIENAALGFSVRKQENSVDENYCYMFQVAAATDSKAATLKCQAIHSSASDTSTKIASVDLTKLGLDIRTGQTHHIKILCQGQSIQVWIDQILCASITNATEFPAGNFGIRCGNSESGSIDNLKITAINGAVLYENDFGSGQNPFTNGGTVSNGVLKVGKGEKLYYVVQSDGLPEKGNVVFLRNEFQIEKPVKKVLVSAIGQSRATIKQYNFKLYVNGSCVGLGSPQSLKDGVYTNVYSTFDVTDLIGQGDNAIGAICYAVTDQRFQMQMKVFYEDGTTAVFVTDDSWKGLDGTRIYGDDGTTIGGSGYYTAMAENIDARLFPYGWNEVGYDDSNWNPVTVQTTITDLIASPIENMTEYEMPVQSVVNKGNGNYFITLEKEIIGGIRLTLPNGVEGAKLTMLYGEETNGENTVKWKMNTGNTYREFWTLKDGAQVIENFGMKGFRYIEIQDCPVEITADMITGVAYRQAFNDDDASFDSSSQILNDIFDLVQYTIKATNQDIYVDSQTRERSYGNSGDVYINAKTSYAVSRSYTLAWYTTHCMDVITAKGYQITEYNIHAILTAWEMYRYTGNAEMLAQDYEHFIKLLQLDHLDEETGLFWFQYDQTFRDLVDWPNSERDGYHVFDCYYNTVVNSYQYKGLLTVADIAEVLGKTEDAAKYRTMAAELKTNINNTFFNVNGDGLYIEGMKKDGTLVTGTATPATLYPLLHGLVDDPQDYAYALEYVADKGFTGSVFGAQFLLELLYKAGMGDRAYALLTDTGLKSWAHMMYDLGATITTEAWDPSRKPNMTYSHPWGSAAGNAIVEGLCGITTLSAGYNSIQIKPQLGDLEFVDIKTPTIKGSILLKVTTQEEGYSTVLMADIPANTTATVYVPVNGSPVSFALVDGVKTPAAREGDYLVFENVGSGGHTFAIPESAIDLSGAEITLSPSDFTYDGTAKEPAVTVELSGKVLTEGADYIVTYTNNTAVGTATVTITGKGNYAGTATKAFTISAPFTDAEAQIGAAKYGTLAEAIENAASGNIIELLKPAVVEGNVTWNLEGVTLNLSETNDITVNGNLTIEDGTFVGGIITADAGSIVINNGVFTCGVAAPIQGSNITVNGGLFSHKLEDSYCAKGYIPTVVPNSDGMYTIQAIGDTVAQNQITGVLYTTVAEALQAAEDTGTTVKLVADSAEYSIVVPAGVTLELNGKTLTANYVNAFGPVVDRIGTGLLKSVQGKTNLFAQNAYLSVWNGEGYIFLTGIALSADTNVKLETTESGVKFSFLPVLNAQMRELMADGGSDNGVKLVVRLNWTLSDGNLVQEPYDITFDDAFVQQVYSSETGEWCFVLTVKNAANVNGLIFNIVLVSDTGAELVSKTVS